MFRKSLLLTLLALLSLVLAACGGDAAGGDAGAASSDLPALSQQLSSTQDGVTLTASVPDGWVSNTDGQIVAATKQELIEGGPDMEASAGDMLVAISAFPSDMIGFMVEGDEVTPTALLETFSQFMTEEGSEMGEIQAVTVGGVEGAKLLITSPQGAITMYAIERDVAFIMMVAGSERTEAASRAPLFEAILATVAVSAASE